MLAQEDGRQRVLNPKKSALRPESSWRGKPPLGVNVPSEAPQLREGWHAAQFGNLDSWAYLLLTIGILGIGVLLVPPLSGTVFAPFLALLLFIMAAVGAGLATLWAVLVQLGISRGYYTSRNGKVAAAFGFGSTGPWQLWIIDIDTGEATAPHDPPVTYTPLRKVLDPNASAIPRNSPLPSDK